MRPFHFSLASLLIIWTIFSQRIFADPVPVVFLDSRPTNLEPKNARCELILREIPRQALLIALTQDLDRPCIVRDATVEPAATPVAENIQLGVAREVVGGIRVHLFDGKNAELHTMVLDPACDNAHTVKYDDYTEKVDELVRSTWLNLAAKELAANVKPCPFSADLEAVPNTDALLETLDFHHAALAARLTHAAIVKEGESPARLSVLTRAYAHMGLASRHLFNGQSSAFFARALVYGNRLTRLGPQSPLAWWSRAYAEALFATPTSAAAHLRKGNDLAAAAHVDPPRWVELLDPLIHYNTMALYDEIQNKPSGLASYFALLTIEHSPLPSLPINFARVALNDNPGAVSLEACISDNAGVGLLHQTTEESPRILNRMVSQLSTDADDPAVRELTAQALKARFAQESIVKLLAELEARPAEAGQLLPWTSYAAFVRECEFADALRRLVFVAYVWSVDADGEIQNWWPLVKNHRYAPMIRVIRRSNQPPDPRLVKQVEQLDFKDDTAHLSPATMLFYYLQIPRSPRLGVQWQSQEMAQDDRTAADFARHLWFLRAQQNVEQYVRRGTTELESTAPEHPLVLAGHAAYDWESLAPKLDDLQRTAAENPIIGFAIGNGLLAHGQPEKAIPLLQYVMKVAPDYTSASTLAQAYLENKDETSWQQTWDHYLKDTEDFGLDHAKAGELVALHLMAERKYQEALPYAKTSADSFSEWGLTVYADCLIDLRRYTEAERVMAAAADRYDDPFNWCEFVLASHKGDRARAEQVYDAWFQTRPDKESPGMLLDYAVIKYAVGTAEKPRLALQSSFDQAPDRLTALLLASQFLAENKTDQAKSALSKSQATPQPESRDHRYELGVEEFLRCLSDPNALPDQHGPLAASFGEPQSAPQRGNNAYVMGRLCELRNKADQAKWWYKQSLDADTNNTFRILAADGMRRLGEDYYQEH